MEFRVELLAQFGRYHATSLKLDGRSSLKQVMREIPTAKSPPSFRSLLDNWAGILRIAFLQQAQQASDNLNTADLVDGPGRRIANHFSTGREVGR